jgi:hypothetical protein
MSKQAEKIVIETISKIDNYTAKREYHDYLTKKAENNPDYIKGNNGFGIELNEKGIKFIADNMKKRWKE